MKKLVISILIGLIIVGNVFGQYREGYIEEYEFDSVINNVWLHYDQEIAKGYRVVSIKTVEETYEVEIDEENIAIKFPTPESFKLFNKNNLKLSINFHAAVNMGKYPLDSEEKVIYFFKSYDEGQKTRLVNRPATITFYAKYVTINPDSYLGDYDIRTVNISIWGDIKSSIYIRPISIEDDEVLMTRAYYLENNKLLEETARPGDNKSDITELSYGIISEYLNLSGDRLINYFKEDPERFGSILFNFIYYESKHYNNFYVDGIIIPIRMKITEDKTIIVDYSGNIGNYKD
jgi:hypothetical protein